MDNQFKINAMPEPPQEKTTPDTSATTPNLETNYPKSKPTISILAFLALLAVGAYSAFSFFSNQSQIAANQELQSQQAQLSTELAQYNPTELQSAITALNTLSQIEAGEIIWSNVVSLVQDLIPTDENGRPKIIVGSYSGNENGSINLSATSNPDRGSSSGLLAYQDVAELIATFNQSNIFANGFIPSIAKGLSEEGQTVLSFNFSAEYAPTRVARTNNTNQDSDEQ